MGKVKQAMAVKITYIIWLLLNNLIGLFFIGLVFLGSPNLNKETLNHITEEQAVFNQFLYGVIVSLFFSLLSLLLSFIFKNRLSLSFQYRRKLFFIQFVFFLVFYFIGYTIIYIL